MSTLQGQLFTSSGTFTVPAGVSMLWALIQGTGGSGCNQTKGSLSGNVSAPSGGGGSLGTKVPISVSPGESVTITISSVGAKSSVPYDGSNHGSDPAITYCKNMGAGGGGVAFAVDAGHGYGGCGGGAGGFYDLGVSSISTTLYRYGVGANISGGRGAKGSTRFFGGTGGGGPSGGAGQVGGTSVDNKTGGTNGTGGGGFYGSAGGGASVFGVGGDGGDYRFGGGDPGNPGGGAGAGGGGAGAPATLFSSVSGGDGSTGVVIVYWVA